MNEEEKTLKGIILKKEVKNSANPKAPPGNLYLDLEGVPNKFTCWSRTSFDEVIEGENIEIVYTEKESDYGMQRSIIALYKFDSKGNKIVPQKQTKMPTGNLIDAETYLMFKGKRYEIMLDGRDDGN